MKNVAIIWDSSNPFDTMDRRGFLRKELEIIDYYANISDRCYVIGSGNVNQSTLDLPKNAETKLLRLKSENEFVQWILYNIWLFFLVSFYNFDIVVIQGVSVPFAVIAAKMKMGKVVTKYRYDWAFQVSNINYKNKNLIFSKVIDLIETTSLKNSDLVIAITDYLKDLASKKGCEKIFVIPLGVNLKKFKFDVERAAEIKNELGLQRDARIVGYIGRFHAVKNLPILIDALKEVTALKYDLHLVLIGSGSQEKILKEKIKDLGLEDKVSFIANVPNEAIPDYLSMFDIFVLPSLREGLPKALIEAMACGIPPIVSQIPDLSNLITNNMNGLFFSGSSQDLANKIINLLDNQRYRYEIGKKSRETIENEYSIESVMRKELDLIKNYL